MSYLTSIDINKRLHEHLLHYINTYDRDWFVICAQGSMNYGIMNEDSDVDTKVLVIPSLEDIAFNRKPISHTLEMPDNGEHVDCKDVREYFKVLRKSNINFVEILFTDYYIVNNKYYDFWNLLLKNAEKIARINPYAAVACTKGMAYSKRKALTHPLPGFGYNPKELSHLIRLNYFLKRYIDGEPYKDCIYPKAERVRKQLIDWKNTGCGLNKEEAEVKADELVENIVTVADDFCSKHSNENNFTIDALLNEILYNIIRCSLIRELIEKESNISTDGFKLKLLQMEEKNKELENLISWYKYPESMGR